MSGTQGSHHCNRTQLPRSEPMRRISMSLTCLFVIVFLAASALAQMPMTKLDYLVGNWTTEGDMKPGPMGPGGKFTTTDQLQWMEGKFFLVMHSKLAGADRK